MRTQIELSQDKNLTLILRILRYFIPYGWHIALSFVCIALVSACTAGTAWLIQPAMDRIFTNHDDRALILVPLAYIGLTLLKGLGRYGQNVSLHYAGVNVLRAMRNQVFQRLIRLPLGYFEKSEIGAFMAHITSDVAMMQQALPAVIGIVRQTLTMLGLMGVVFYQNWRMALCSLVALPALIVPIRWFSRKLRRYGRKNANLTAEVTSLLQEMLSGIRVIKAFATETRSGKLFDSEYLRLQRVYFHQILVNELASPTMELISAFGVGIILWFGGSQVLNGSMTEGEFFSFIGALAMMYAPFKSMNSAMMTMQNALAGGERVFGMLDSRVLMPESSGRRRLSGTFEELRFENVSFAYDPEAEAVLADVSLTIRAGERVALVGPSGAGKSTFVNLIPRFYDPQAGGITLNGHPLHDYDLADLRRHVAVVSQEAFLFNLSAAENISYGTEDATPEAIRAAAGAAYADSFISDLPAGYDTALGERGSRLSGGQKQRLTIARAILKDAPLLILDEATSALDSEAEHMVQQALDNLMEGKTSIVIAHRLSTVLGADRILVLDKGRIVASGRHEALLRDSELYAKLYALQFKTE